MSRLYAIYSSLRPYGLAVLAVAAATVIGQIEPFRGMPTGLFMFVTVLTTLSAGLRAGLLAAALSCLVIDFFFMHPLYSFAITYVQDLLRLVVFVVSATIVNVGVRWQQDRLEDSLLASRAAHGVYETHAWHVLFNTLVESLTDRAVFILDVHGNVASWNLRAECMTGYSAAEACGQHLGRFYASEHLARENADRDLQTALTEGRLEEDRWLARPGGSRFRARVLIVKLEDLATHFSSGADLTFRRDDSPVTGSFLVVFQIIGDEQLDRSMTEQSTNLIERTAEAIHHD
jgi:PAS domain S-box-containing protein